MRRITLALLAALVSSGPVLADDKSSGGGRTVIGQDVFVAGQNISEDQEAAADLFAAGERVEIEEAVAGSTHVLGRWITLDETVGQNVYAAGQTIALKGDVAGNATLFAQEIETDGDVAGNLRVTGSDIDVEGDIGGYGLITGEDVDLDARVGGDLILTVREIEFGSDAEVAGRVVIYESRAGAIEVPERVAPADRIERHLIEDRGWDRPRLAWRGAIRSFLSGVIIVALLAALIAAVAPETLADMRRRLLDRPGRMFAVGFVAQSALIGSGVLFAMTIIGMFLTPAAIFLSFLAGFFGYVVGAYALGVFLTGVAGRPEPDSLGDRALAAGVGALVAGIVALIPFLGWLFVLALVLAGLGTITTRLLPQRTGY